MANTIMVIKPYRWEGLWVFDDPAVGLEREPFVAGIPEMIDRLVAEIPNAAGGFRLTFSSVAFPGHQLRIDLRREEAGGRYYHSDEYQMEGWLCPALFRYFESAPEEIYVRADAIAASD